MRKIDNVKIICKQDLNYNGVHYFTKGEKFFAKIYTSPFKAIIFVGYNRTTQFDERNKNGSDAEYLFYETFTTEKELLNAKIKKMKNS